jgi:hypothetical protein
MSKIASIMLAGLLLTTTAYGEDTKARGDTAIIGKDSTLIDFNAANIDGKMQAPSGFFLQGREAQAMTQMVKLRAKFRSELRNSKSAVKDIAR